MARATGVPAAAAWTSSKRLHQVERAGIEERELLLHRDREVGARVEALARLAQELVVGTRCSSPIGVKG